MTRSSLTTGTTSYGSNVLKRNVRERGVDMFIVHHAASTSLEVVRSIFAQDGGRGTSANYIVGNEGQILAAVPEEYRAWTSGGKRDGATVDGARYDHRAITVETVNATGAPSWTISAAAFDSLARLIEDCSRRYGFPLDRDHVIGHRELLTRFSAGYATACPGGIDVGALVARARAIRIGEQTTKPDPAPEPKEEARDMFTPDLFINRTKQGMTGLGVAIFADGRVEGLTRQQWQAWGMLGARQTEVKVNGHWSFLMAAASRARAAAKVPEPTEIAKAVADELGTTTAKLLADIKGA